MPWNVVETLFDLVDLATIWQSRLVRVVTASILIVAGSIVLYKGVQNGLGLGLLVIGIGLNLVEAWLYYSKEN